MEQIKKLVEVCEDNVSELSVKMIDLEVIHGAVTRLLCRLDEIADKKWHENRAMSYLSINEIRDTVRLIDMGFRPLFKGMNSDLKQLHSHSTQLLDVVHTNLENEKSR